MGERFSRFRAAWGDLWTDPLRGLPIRERWRLQRLATSGRRIGAPADARRVRDLISSHRRLARRLLVVMMVLLPPLVVGEALLVLGQVPRRPLLGWALRVGGYLAVGLVHLHILRRYARTSRANAWDV